MTQYRVVITISHRMISLEYHLQGAGDSLKPFGKGVWPAPLAFYVSGDGFIIGEDAVNAAVNGNPNAFTDYFQVVRSDRTFSHGGRTYHANQLLVKAVEEYFRYFYREDCLRKFGDLENNRGEMPLILAFDADVQPNERVIISQDFSDAGYGKLKTVCYGEVIGHYLSHNSRYGHTLVAWSNGADMHYSLYEKGNSAPKASITLEGLGLDPRIDLICRQIWDEYIQRQTWALTYENELPRLRAEAKEFLRSGEPEIDGEVRLSDQTDANYYINRYAVNSMLSESGNAMKLQRGLDEFLRENGIRDKSQMMLLLRGDASGSDYFRSQLSGGFGSVEEADKDMRREVKNLLLNISFEGEPAPTYKKPISQANPPMGVTPDQPESKGGFKGFGSADESWRTPPPPPIEVNSISDAEKKEQSRKLRQDFALAKGAARAGKFEEALKMLGECLAIAEAFAPEKTTEIRKEIADVEAELAKKNSPKSKETRYSSRQTDSPENKGGRRRPEGHVPNGQGAVPHQSGNSHSPAGPKQHPAGNSPDEGEKLVKQGKLKEARDWYKSVGGTEKVQKLNEVIRMERGVRIWYGKLEAYQKAKDPQKTRRVIHELKEYITLCKKSNVPCEDYNELLGKYQKIK